MMMVMTRKVVFGYVSGYVPLVKRGRVGGGGEEGENVCF